MGGDGVMGAKEGCQGGRMQDLSGNWQIVGSGGKGRGVYMLCEKAEGWTKAKGVGVYLGKRKKRCAGVGVYEKESMEYCCGDGALQEQQGGERRGIKKSRKGIPAFFIDSGGTV